MSSFEGKTVIITGAASGIGKTTALAFANQGANVVFADINYELVKETAAEIGERGLAVDVNVAKLESCQAMIDVTIEKFGQIDVLCNNAGIGTMVKPLAEQSLSNWKRVMDVNLNGVFFGIKSAIPHMQKNGGGVIINTASMVGTHPMSHMGPYTASKHAVIGLTKTVALEYGKDNIRCVSVSPGCTRTSMPVDGPIGEKINEVAKSAPIRSDWGEPGEIAEMVLWLASDKASYVTGSNHIVDGALLAGFSMG